MPQTWTANYVETHSQASEYLIGILTGYIIYSSKSSVNKVKSKRILFAIFGAWILSISFIFFHIFCVPHFYFTPPQFVVYRSLCNELLACFICWIIYATHVLKSGEIIKVFLSQQFLQPLSKLCLSVYMIHYIYIYYTIDYTNEAVKIPGLGWLIHLSVGDIFISIVLALIFHLLVEAPAAKIINLLWKRKIKVKQILNFSKIQEIRVV